MGRPGGELISHETCLGSRERNYRPEGSQRSRTPGQRLLQSLKRLLMAMDGYRTDQRKSIDFVEKFERRMVWKVKTEEKRRVHGGGCAGGEG